METLIGKKDEKQSMVHILSEGHFCFRKHFYRCKTILLLYLLYNNIMCFGTGHTTDKKKYKAYGNSFFFLHQNHYTLTISWSYLLWMYFFFRHRRLYIANLSDYILYERFTVENIVKKRIIMERYG